MRSRLMTILVSVAVAVLLAMGAAWGQDAALGDDQSGEVPFGGTEGADHLRAGRGRLD